MFAYAGTRTSRERDARGEGITVFKLEPDTGALHAVQVVTGLVNPSFLAISRKRGTLYCVHGDQQEASAFRIDPLTGILSLINTQACGGRNPVHLALDGAQDHVLVSNHLSGNLCVMPLAVDGGLRAVSQCVALQGTAGPHRVEQPFSKPHFNPFSSDGRYVLVPDKGLDRIFSFRFAQGRLEETPSASVATREAAGPRHLASHPFRPWIYVVNELDSSVTAYRFDVDSGAMEPFQRLSSLPDTFTGNNRAAEIEMDAAGRFLYVSNRGHDSIAVFAIEALTGRMRWVEAQDCLGRTPRFFGLSPDQRWLYVLNEDSDNIVQFARHAQTGGVSPTGRVQHCASPVCLVFAAAPELPGRRDR